VLFSTRRPCLRASSYSAPSASTENSDLDTSTGSPIRDADKSKSRRRIKNVFIDDRGFPDQSDEFDVLLHNIDGSPVLWKLKHPPPQIRSVDPMFSFSYDEALHGKRLRTELDQSHLDVKQQTLYALVKKYWSVFDKHGVFVPVRNYKCVIDTGDAHPIAVKKIMYGPNKLPIMQKAVAALEKVCQIRQITNGRWLFKAVLAAKPHQEHVRHIKYFVWRFCVNYVPLNSVTRVIAYPIPRCDAAVSEEFGTGQWMWLFDAPSGYHQLAVAPPVKRNSLFRGLTLSSGLIRLCPLAQLMDRLHSLISFMMSIASGNLWLKRWGSKSTMTPIRESSWMTSSTMAEISPRPCYTWNANFGYARPTVYL
jgi:hypothetical protein